MKRYLLICPLAAATFSTYAQKDTADNYVRGFLTVPAFNINIVPDSSFYTNEKLKKNTAFMVMFFSPATIASNKQKSCSPTKRS